MSKSTKKASRKTTRKSNLNKTEQHNIYAIAAKRAWATTYQMKAKKATGAKRTEFLAKAKEFVLGARQLAKKYKYDTDKEGFQIAA
jgi:hypothetical protein